MSTPERQGTQLLLPERPIPQINNEQLEQYTHETLRTRRVESFNPAHAKATLKECKGRKVIGVDFGVNSIVAIPFTVQKEGKLMPDEQLPEPLISINTGENYWEYLQKIAKDAKKRGIPIGMSAAGLVEGTKLLPSPTASAFRDRLAEDPYCSDLTQLIPTLQVVYNDAQAAIKTSVLEAYTRGYLPAETGNIVAMEPGHVRLVDPPQPLRKTIPYELCRMNGNKYVCVESVIGGDTGIRSQWKKIKNEDLTGKDITTQYLQGNDVAAKIYDTSATHVATGILGMGYDRNLLGEDARSGLLISVVGGGNGGAGFVIPTTPSETQEDVVLAFHGGVFKVPGYKERIAQILKQKNVMPRFVSTGDFSVNAGAEGAAMGALITLAA